MNLESLKYPIGKPDIPENITTEMIADWIQTIEEFPNRLQQLVSHLLDFQLDTVYRPGGWTIRQVVHHIADSHLNSYIRFKWTLTEEKPIIKAYYEDRWADMFDSKFAPISLALSTINSLHAKWVYLLKGLSETQLKRIFIHPEGSKEVCLVENIAIYAWHCNHHYAHIENVLMRNNWINKNVKK